MKAAILHGLGQSLQIEEIPTPTPAADEVLLRVEACGVCHSDLHIIQNDWPDAMPLQFPAILGHEVVGRVVDMGSSAKIFEVGTRVGVGWLCWTCGTCKPCSDGCENLCLQRVVTGVQTPGGYAEYMCVKATHAIEVPNGLSSHQAAPYFCAGVTMYHACRNADISPAQEVAIVGVGGLGHLGVQIAQQFGARVTAVDLSAERLELARSLGAERLIDASAADAATKMAANGGHHTAIVTAPSQSAYTLALRSLRLRGTLVVVGLPKQDLVFSADQLATEEFRIIGSAVGTRGDLRNVLRMAAEGRVRCEVETHPLESLVEILNRMRDGTVTGRAVITFAD